MEQENYIIIMANSFLKGNIQIMKDVEKEKNIMKKVIQNLMENI